MKRSNFLLAIAIMILSALFPIAAKAEKVIYSGICTINTSDMTDDSTEAFMLALGGLGELKITDMGNGVYLIKSTLGKETFIKDIVSNAKVINSQKVTFDYKSSSGKTVSIIMTPEELDLAGSVKLILVNKNAFSSMVNSLQGVKNSSTKSTNQSGGQKAKNILQPTSGNLTALTFVNHPFGFMPQGPMTQADACSYLRQANWPSDPYSSSLISIISSTPFRIPFKMYGKDVSTMSMSWYKGECTGYDLTVSDLKTKWTKNDAIHFAQKIYSELINNGYRETEVKYKSSTRYYEKAVTNGTVYIGISAFSASLYSSHDAYDVEIKVRF